MARTTKPKPEEQAEVTADSVVDDAPAKDQRAVTGRPNDTPIAPSSSHFTNSTFASRAKARGTNKRVDGDDTESK